GAGITALAESDFAVGRNEFQRPIFQGRNRFAPTLLDVGRGYQRHRGFPTKKPDTDVKRGRGARQFQWNRTDGGKCTKNAPRSQLLLRRIAGRAVTTTVVRLSRLES